MKRRMKKENGQAMVEFALVLPVLLLIICGILDFGWLFYNQLSLNNDCREAARYIIVNSDEDMDTIKNHINQCASDMFHDEMYITVEYTDNTNHIAGDVEVTLTTNMVVLTPVMHVICGGGQRAITSHVIMKVES